MLWFILFRSDGLFLFLSTFFSFLHVFGGVQVMTKYVCQTTPTPQTRLFSILFLPYGFSLSWIKISSFFVENGWSLNEGWCLTRVDHIIRKLLLGTSGPRSRFTTAFSSLHLTACLSRHGWVWSHVHGALWSRLWSGSCAPPPSFPSCRVWAWSCWTSVRSLSRSQNSLWPVCSDPLSGAPPLAQSVWNKLNRVSGTWSPAGFHRRPPCGSRTVFRPQ